MPLFYSLIYLHSEGVL